MVERMISPELNLSGRSMISLTEWAPEEIRGLLSTAHWMKLNRDNAGLGKSLSSALKGKHVALIFELPSTRTRVSFQVAVSSLGGEPLMLNWEEMQTGRGEPMSDTARVLSRYVDGIVIRSRKHETIQELRKWSSVPLFNALTDKVHPFQVLADALTIWEHRGGLSGIRLAYVGDGNNMANSYLTIGAKLGWHVSIATPEAYGPDPQVLEWAKRETDLTGGSVTWTTDPAQAAFGADAIATDVWVSMADEDIEFKRQQFLPYQVNTALLATAKPDALFLHCLPAHRGEEVTSEVLEGPQSVVFDQAENRLWVQKSALYHALS